LRQLIIEVVDNEVARRFWQHDFENYRNDEFGPPRHKLSKLLVSGIPSLMLLQPESALNLRQIMDDRKILLANLSTVGSDVRETLGCFLLALLHQAALTRSTIPVSQRPEFHIYCDETHRFVTEAIEDLISETRKFGVSLTLAHHYLSQFGIRQADALASVGSTIIFNVDTKDAIRLCKDLRGKVKKDALIALEQGEAIARIGTSVVRIWTPMPATELSDDRRIRIISESRRRYYKPIAEVRQTIARRYERWATPFASLVPSGSESEELVYETF
jgi:hypothetical protein